MKTKAILSVFCLLSAYCLLSTAYCFSAVPSLINYQGVLKDSTGVPYNGNATMVFSIWDDSADGSKLWQETQDIVSVSHGLFNVLLGSSEAIPDSVFAQPNSWLQVIANGSQLSPRRRIVSVGYALHSEFTDTAEYAFSAPPDDDWDIDTAGFNVYRLTGNVGIGTPSPQEKLEVNGNAHITGDLTVDGNINPSAGCWRHSGAQVFSGSSPSSWTDLDLSSYVGSNHALVILKIKKNSGGSYTAVFRPNGDSDEYWRCNDLSDMGAQGHKEECGEAGIIVVETDASGIIEWKCGADVTLTLLGYVK